MNGYVIIVSGVGKDEYEELEEEGVVGEIHSKISDIFGEEIDEFNEILTRGGVLVEGVDEESVERTKEILQQYGIPSEKQLVDERIDRRVHGQVEINDPNLGFGDITVVAIDSSADRPLGESDLNDAGRYKIKYRAHTGEQIDLVVGAYDADSNVLAESEPVPGAEQTEEIDIEIGEREQENGDSEREEEKQEPVADAEPKGEADEHVEEDIEEDVEKDIEDEVEDIPELEVPGDEVFRFMAVNRTDFVNTDRPRRQVEYANRRTALLSGLEETQSRDEMVEIATEFEKSDEFVTDLSELDLSLDEFRDAIRSKESADLSREELESMVGKIFKGSPSEIAGHKDYENARRQLEDSFAAVSVAPEGTNKKGIDTDFADGIRILEAVRMLSNDEADDDLVGVFDSPVAVPKDVLDFDIDFTGGDDADNTEKSDINEDLLSEFSKVRKSITEINHLAFVATPPEGQKKDEQDHDEVSETNFTKIRRGKSSGKGSRESVEVDGMETDDDGTTLKIASLSAKFSDDVRNEVEKVVSVPLEEADIQMTVEQLHKREAQLGAEILETLVGPGEMEMVWIGDSFVPAGHIDPSFADQVDSSQDIDWGSFLPDTTYPPNPHVDVLGITELEVVRQELEKYELGELSNVENVLQGERRERKHRRLNRTEREFETERSSVEEREDHLEKTERFELQREAQDTIREQSSFAAGAEVSASYGPFVEVDAYTDYSTSSASEDTTRTAQNYAKDVVQKSVNKIQTEIHERELQRIIKEIEETNTHGVDNVDGDGHVAGLYRWIDKIYRAQVFNYGNRLMLEFLVPEPSAFYRYAQASNPAENVRLQKPEPPRYTSALDAIYQNPNSNIDSIEDISSSVRDLRPIDLNESNYQYYVQRYGVSDISPPPEQYLVRGKAFDKQLERDQWDRYTVDSGNIDIPDGYRGKKAYFRTNFISKTGVPWFQLIVGDRRRTIYSENNSANSSGELNFRDDRRNIDSVPVTIARRRTAGYGVTILVVCERMESRFEDWQIDTYDAIMSAYRRKRSNYEDAVAAAEIQQGIDETGGSNNPGRNKEIVENEIKKSATKLIRQQYFDQNAILDTPAGPRIDMPATAQHRNVIQFFEHALEWQQMSYVFYPYYWTGRDKWATLQGLDDNDDRFARFLRAGAARVLVPVRPGYNQDILYFLQTHTLYSGEGRPEIGDPRYLPISEEIKERDGHVADEEPVGEPWLTRVPTSLVKLQKSQKLSDVEIGENGE